MNSSYSQKAVNCNIRDFYKVHISDKCSLNDIIASIKNSTTDFVVLMDIHTTTIEFPGTDIDISYDKKFYVPQLVSMNKDTCEPMGNVTNHINITQSLRIQSVYANDDINVDYIPNCIVAHKTQLLKYLRKCDRANSIFLELSFLLREVIRINGWIVKSYIANKSAQIRSRVAKKYLPMFSGMFDLNGNYENNSLSEIGSNKYKTNLYKLNEIIHDNDILLVDKPCKDYESMKFRYTTFSTDPFIVSNYYIALLGQDPYNFDPNRSFMQITMHSARLSSVVNTEDLDPIATFSIKRHSENILFAPPYTESGHNVLTALEIILSFKPRNVTIVSDNILKCLFSNGKDDGIKREFFMSKIMEYCNENDINLNINSNVGALFK